MNLLKSIVIVSFSFSMQKLFAQDSTIKKRTIQPVQVYYSTFGWGAIGKFEPVFRTNDTMFIYAKEQSSSWEPTIVRNNRVDTINSGFFRRSSIDSILNIISKFGDTTIFKSNPCIRGGGIKSLYVAVGTDTVRFTLGNTMDYDALKIIKIINQYLPEDEKIYASEEQIKETEECWATMFKERPRHKKKKYKRKTK